MKASAIQEVRKRFSQAGDRLRLSEPMSRHTTFKIGGPADLFFEPVTIEEVRDFGLCCREYELDLYVCGQGSNILVSDKGIRGAVMSLADRFSGMSFDEQTRFPNVLLSVRSGTRLSTLAIRAAQACCTGLEFASGIPGTVGGAVYMNAGAYDGCMADVVIETMAMTGAGKVYTVRGKKHEFGYRSSLFSQQKHIILNSTLELGKNDYERICQRMQELTDRRKAKQPLDLASAGSAFKRPENSYAGKLIAECGLKGYQIGAAQVSQKHAGFIVNLGSATAHDVRKLFEHVQSTVFEKTGIKLCPEVQFIGEWSHGIE